VSDDKRLPAFGLKWSSHSVLSHGTSKRNL
jgi:hypothetical protein